MQNVERSSITLPADMARMIRAKVEEGRYASNSEVIREAKRAWQEQEQPRAQRLTALRAKIAEACPTRSWSGISRKDSNARSPRARRQRSMLSLVYRSFRSRDEHRAVDQRNGRAVARALRRGRR